MWKWLKARWEYFFPNAQIIVASDDGRDPFNKSLAINKAAMRAKTDVLAILDADTWVHAAVVRKALEEIRGGAPWMLPCMRAKRLTRDFTDAVLSLPPDAPFPQPIEGSYEEQVEAVGFLHILPRDAWKAVPMDERFRGWGGEDRAYIYSLDNLWGRHWRLDGTAFSLYHARPRDPLGRRLWEKQDPEYRNQELNSRYFNARHNRRLLAELAEESQWVFQQRLARSRRRSVD